MTLLKFLTSGKSLVGGQPSAGRYRLLNPGAMPKFESAKNPFRSSTRSNTAEAVSRLAEPGVVSTLPNETPPRPAIAPGHDPEPVIPPKPSSWITKFLAVTTGFLPRRRTVKARPQPSHQAQPRPSNPGALFPWRRDGAHQSVGPRTGKPMVQSELSLEAVKVVRNDLTDSDLEIVAAKKITMPAAENEPSRTLARSTSNVPASAKPEVIAEVKP